MDSQTAKWIVNVLMGAVFLVSFCTGVLKFTLLMRGLGLTSIVLPLARISDIHDWAGLVLGIFVAIHLFLNRAWILTMTKKMIARAAGSP